MKPTEKREKKRGSVCYSSVNRLCSLTVQFTEEIKEAAHSWIIFKLISANLPSPH